MLGFLTTRMVVGLQPAPDGVEILAGFGSDVNDILSRHSGGLADQWLVLRRDGFAKAFFCLWRLGQSASHVSGYTPTTMIS